MPASTVITGDNGPHAILPDPRRCQTFSTGSGAAQAALPLQGVTILAVEDSRFACEALRLMSMRSGARLRRAGTLLEARAHLRCYRPDVVIVDLGLPDGRGEALIRDLATSARRPKVLLGTSGDPEGRAASLAAGADLFLDKPLESLAQFCETLRQNLPGLGLASLADEIITPDRLALHDDLSRAAQQLDKDHSTGDHAASRRYLTSFLLGIADQCHDTSLAQAAGAASNPQANLSALRQLIRKRLEAPEAQFFANDQSQSRKQSRT